MDGCHERIRRDPKAALESLKHQESVLQHRVDLIEQLNALDTSFGGAEEVGKRMDLLREMDADDEIIEDTVRLVAHHARRGARHAARAAVQERLLRLLPARSAFESAGWAPGDPLLTVFFYVSFAD